MGNEGQLEAPLEPANEAVSGIRAGQGTLVSKQPYQEVKTARATLLEIRAPRPFS